MMSVDTTLATHEASRTPSVLSLTSANALEGETLRSSHTHAAQMVEPSRSRSL